MQDREPSNEKPAYEPDTTGRSCGAKPAFNNTVGVISTALAVMIGYLLYTQVLR